MSMVGEYDVTLSMRPLMVTFGAGAWAYAMGAAMARMAKAIIRTARLGLFMRLSSIRSMTSNLLHLALSDFPLCAQRRYGSRDECFSLSPPRKKRIGKGLTFLPRIICRGQEKSRWAVWAQNQQIQLLIRPPHCPGALRRPPSPEGNRAQGLSRPERGPCVPLPSPPVHEDPRP